jgi:hypothetical protein
VPLVAARLGCAPRAAIALAFAEPVRDGQLGQAQGAAEETSERTSGCVSEPPQAATRRMAQITVAH